MSDLEQVLSAMASSIESLSGVLADQSKILSDQSEVLSRCIGVLENLQRDIAGEQDDEEWWKGPS